MLNLKEAQEIHLTYHLLKMNLEKMMIQEVDLIVKIPVVGEDIK
jgi:hypothetical protein